MSNMYRATRGWLCPMSNVACCHMQEWMGAPSTGAGTEGPTSLAELQPEASAWDSLDGWASAGGAGSSVEADAAASTSAAGSLQASLASVELPPSDIAAGLTAVPDDDSVEADARGALSRLVRRLTPQWLSPRVRGLVLLWALVALVATNWCACLVATRGSCILVRWMLVATSMPNSHTADCHNSECCCRVLVKDAGGLDPLVFCAARFACAAAFFLPFLPEALREETGELLPAGIELGLWTSAGYLTQVRARLTPVSAAHVVDSCSNNPKPKVTIASDAVEPCASLHDIDMWLQAIGLSTTDASRASFISTFTVLAVSVLRNCPARRNACMQEAGMHNVRERQICGKRQIAETGVCCSGALSGGQQAGGPAADQAGHLALCFWGAGGRVAAREWRRQPTWPRRPVEFAVCHLLWCSGVCCAMLSELAQVAACAFRTPLHVFGVMSWVNTPKH